MTQKTEHRRLRQPQGLQPGGKTGGQSQLPIPPIPCMTRWLKQACKQRSQKAQAITAILTAWSTLTSDVNSVAFVQGDKACNNLSLQDLTLVVLVQCAGAFLSLLHVPFALCQLLL